MKSFGFIGFGLATGLLAAAALGQEAQAPAIKLGFVDVEKALASTEEGKVKLKQLDDWARPKQDEINQRGKELSDLQAEMVSKQGTASSDVLEDLNRKFVSRKRDLEDLQRVAKRDFDERQNAVLRDLGGKLQDVITKYADQNRYTAVFILKPNDLAYLATSADLTDTVVKLYNAQYPVQAKAPSPAPAK